MAGKVRVTITRLHDRVGLYATIFRDVHYDYKAVRYEVLADNGKWREKGEGEVLFDDEKIRIQEE